MKLNESPCLRIFSNEILKRGIEKIYREQEKHANVYGSVIQFIDHKASY